MVNRFQRAQWRGRGNNSRAPTARGAHSGIPTPDMILLLVKLNKNGVTIVTLYIVCVGRTFFFFYGYYAFKYTHC